MILRNNSHMKKSLYLYGNFIINYKLFKLKYIKRKEKNSFLLLQNIYMYVVSKYHN